MCGIAGIIQTGPFYTAEHLKKMTTALAHRGPDGEGIWEADNGNILLGHRRLSIIDLSSAAAQPFHYHGRYVAIHNGEIYNYLELREELKKKGYSFRTQSDTEVLVAAFDCWGDGCLDHFDGMFSFAIWDNLEKELFAARDRFGEKPFYYLFDPGQNIFVFASEIKSLWSLGIGKDFNRKMLFNFLTIGYTDNPDDPCETFYDNVSKLPAAHLIRINTVPDLSAVTERYWDIDVEKENLNIPDNDAIDKFREIFATSIRRRLRSDVQLGTSLSGGLDSSSIVATISKTFPIQNGLKTFSAIFPGFERNEEMFIDEVAQRYAAHSAKTTIADEEIPSLFKKTIAVQDEPFDNASILPQFKVFELAKQRDVKVLLDGQGADETLAGYHKYYKWYWQELFRMRKLISTGEIRKARLLGVTEKFRINNVIAALFPDFSSVFLERQYLLHALQQEDLSKEFVRLQSREAYYATPTIFTLNGVLYFNSCMHGLEELLRYADRNSMAHGREVRLPFLSHELVEFLFTLPSNFKIRDGWTKWLLRRSMTDDLPSTVAWRKDKIGLEPPQLNWMLLPTMADMIHEAKKKLVAEKILKPEVIGKEIRAAGAYEKNNFDWRYLVSAQFL